MMPAGLPTAALTVAGARPPPAGADEGLVDSTSADAGRGSAFAGLLASSQMPAAEAAAASAASAAPVAGGKVVPGAAEEDLRAADTALPDQLLALLGGAWATPDVNPAAPVARSAAALGAAATGLPSTPSTLTGANAVGGSSNLLAAGLSEHVITVVSPATPGLGGPSTTGAGITAALPDIVTTGDTPVPAPTAATEGVAAAAEAFDSFASAMDAAVGRSGSAAEGADVGPAPLLGSAPLSGAASTRAPPVALTQPLPLPANPESGFDDGFGARIGWMAEQGIGRAELRVTPDNAGPIDVRLHIDGTRITAEFNSANAEVRQALEASMGRLRDMLGQQGMQLAQSDVGQGRAGGSQQASRSMADGVSDDLTGTDTAGLRPLPMRGLLDEYA